MTINHLKPTAVRTLKNDILYRLDASGKTDKEKLKIIEEIRRVLKERGKDNG